MQLIKIISLLFTVSLLGFTAQAESQNDDDESDFDPTPMIMHHISDAHEWHLWDLTDDETGEKVEVSIPLPVILYHEGTLDVFMSSAFEHGEKTVVKGSNEYILDHGNIYLADESGELTKDQEGEIQNAAPIDISITKNVVSMIFAGIMLLLVFSASAKKYTKNGAPKGIASFMEPLVLFVRDDIAIPNIGEDKYEKYLPYLLTAFFFIWFCNLLGLIPIFPGSANVTGNIAVTMVLAFFTLVITNFSGNKHYWKHIFATPGVPVFVLPIMIVVELIGIFTKPFALMIRLFANITAGHIIILSLISLIFIFESVALAPVSIAFGLFMNVLELLVAALQAYIFTLLSALFIGGAVAEEH